MSKRVSRKDRVLFAYSRSKDVIERVMAEWAENFANTLTLQRGKWLPLRLPNHSRQLLEATLDLEDGMKIVAFYGHGDEASGDMSDADETAAIDADNLDQFQGTHVWGMCCHAGKLLGAHGERAGLKGFFGFMDEVHLGFRSLNGTDDDLEVYDGFENWAADGLQTLLETDCPESSARSLREGAVDWSFASLVTFLEALSQGDLPESMAAFQSALAFSWNSSIVRSS